MNKTNNTSNNKNKNANRRATAETNVLNYAKAWRRNLSRVGVTPATTSLPEQDKLLFYMVQTLEEIEKKARNCRR